MSFVSSKRLTWVPPWTTLLPPLQAIKSIISSMSFSKRVSDKGQPCFTPMVLVKQLDRPPGHCLLSQSFVCVCVYAGVCACLVTNKAIC